MSDIVYESMKVHGKDGGGKYQVYLLGDVDGWRAIFPMLITHDLMCFDGREKVLADLFKERALRLIEQGTTRKD